MPKWDKRVPFTEDGNLMGYPGYVGYMRVEPAWKDNYEFEDTLRFTGFERGRSAAHAIFSDSAGHQMQMFLSNLSDLILSGKLLGTTAKAKWTFCKRGKNFGVRLVKED